MKTPQKPKEPKEEPKDAEKLAEALESVANAIHRLGTNKAAEHGVPPGLEKGAIEVLSLEIREGSTRIADALNNIAEAIKELSPIED